MDESQTRLNPNRVAAYNLRRARQLRGMTQEQAAAAIAPHLGIQWAKQTVAMAEAAATTTGSRRPRQFDAADLVAFSLAFDLPIGWFLMPPRVPRTQAEYNAAGPIKRMEIPFNLPDEPAVAVADLVDAVLDPRLEDRLSEIATGATGYRGLLEQLEARRAERTRVANLRAGVVYDSAAPPAGEVQP